MHLYGICLYFNNKVYFNRKRKLCLGSTTNEKLFNINVLILLTNTPTNSHTRKVFVHTHKYLCYFLKTYSQHFYLTTATREISNGMRLLSMKLQKKKSFPYIFQKRNTK